MLSPTKIKPKTYFQQVDARCRDTYQVLVSPQSRKSISRPRVE